MKKILLIEDDVALYNMYKTELELRDYKVVLETNGAKGVERAKEEKPDLILLDIMLPELDGLTLLEQLKKSEKTKEIPVFVLTNFGEEKNVKRALEGGANDFILKYKIVPSEVADKIDEFFAQEKKPV